MQTYVVILFLFVVIWLHLRQTKGAAVLRGFRKHRSQKERVHMQELAKQFIGKKCYIYTITASAIQGVLREVSQSGLLVETNSGMEAVNLDFVTRLQEIPPKKSRKKQNETTV